MSRDCWSRDCWSRHYCPHSKFLRYKSFPSYFPINPDPRIPQINQYWYLLMQWRHVATGSLNVATCSISKILAIITLHDTKGWKFMSSIYPKEKIISKKYYMGDLETKYFEQLGWLLFYRWTPILLHWILLVTLCVCGF